VHQYLIVFSDEALLYDDVHAMLDEYLDNALVQGVYAIMHEEGSVTLADVTDHNNGEYEVTAGPLYEYVLYEDDEVTEHRYQINDVETVLVDSDLVEADDEEATG
jgi:hypothetical protein